MNNNHSITANDSEELRQAQIHRQRLAELARERRQILSLPPEKALNAIIEHPQGTALVHSMAEEDFYFLIHDIGPADALELLSMATNRQWEFILDQGIWHRDRIDIDAVTQWLKLLLLADAPRFIRWIADEKPEMIEYYLNRTVEVRVLEENDDPSDLEDGFFTHDGIFYLRVPETDIEDEADDDEEEPDSRLEFVQRLIERLADEDLQAYQIMLLRATNVIPSESEEEAFRFRNVRLAEKGFLPFDEAVGVYAPVRPEALRKRKTRKTKQHPDPDLFVPVPIQHAALLDSDSLFNRALQIIDTTEMTDEVRVEFAALCNRMIAADQKPITERNDLRRVVNKSCGYLTIGLHRLTGEDSPDANQCAAMLKDYALIDIFRAGYGMVADIRNRAKKWKAKSWFTRQNLALSFWGERLVGHLGGIFLARPQFFDNYASGTLYRDFATMTDIRIAEAALNEAIAFDDLFSCLEIDTTAFPSGHFITFENVLLTLWARCRIGLSKQVKAIDADSFRPFFETLWTGMQPNTIQPSMKTDFLMWLSESSGLTAPEISENLGIALEKMFDNIAEEYGDVSSAGLDPRYVHLFLLR